MRGSMIYSTQAILTASRGDGIPERRGPTATVTGRSRLAVTSTRRSASGHRSSDGHD